MDIARYLERMDHEFPSHANVTPLRFGYRLDNKKSAKGLKSECNCESYNTVDYILVEQLNGHECFCYVEFSDLHCHYEYILNHIDLIKKLKAPEDKEREWNVLKTDLQKEKRNSVMNELRNKIVSTNFFLKTEASLIENKPTCFDEKPLPIIIHNIAIKREKALEIARFLSNLASDLHNALPHGRFKKPKVTDIHTFCEPVPSADV